MKKIERDQLAKRVAHFYENGAQKDNKIVNILHTKYDSFVFAKLFRFYDEKF